MGGGPIFLRPQHYTKIRNKNNRKSERRRIKQSVNDQFALLGHSDQMVNHRKTKGCKKKVVKQNKKKERKTNALIINSPRLCSELLIQSKRKRYKERERIGHRVRSPTIEVNRLI